MNLDFSDVWKADLEKSSLLGAKPKAMLVKIDHSDPDQLLETEITKIDKTEDRLILQQRSHERSSGLNRPRRERHKSKLVDSRQS